MDERFTDEANNKTPDEGVLVDAGEKDIKLAEATEAASRLQEDSLNLTISQASHGTKQVAEALTRSGTVEFSKAKQSETEESGEENKQSKKTGKGKETRDAKENKEGKQAKDSRDQRQERPSKREQERSQERPRDPETRRHQGSRPDRVAPSQEKREQNRPKDNSERVIEQSPLERQKLRQDAGQKLEGILTAMDAAKPLMLGVNELFDKTGGLYSNKIEAKQAYEKAMLSAHQAYDQAIKQADKLLWVCDAEGKPKLDASGKPIPSEQNKALRKELATLDKEIEKYQKENTQESKQKLALAMAEAQKISDLLRSSGYARAREGLSLLFNLDNLRSPEQAVERAKANALLKEASKFDPAMYGPPMDPNFAKIFAQAEKAGMQRSTSGDTAKQPKFEFSDVKGDAATIKPRPSDTSAKGSDKADSKAVAIAGLSETSLVSYDNRYFVQTQFDRNPSWTGKNPDGSQEKPFVDKKGKARENGLLSKETQAIEITGPGGQKKQERVFVADGNQPLYDSNGIRRLDENSDPLLALYEESHPNRLLDLAKKEVREPLSQSNRDAFNYSIESADKLDRVALLKSLLEADRVVENNPEARDWDDKYRESAPEIRAKLDAEISKNSQLLEKVRLVREARAWNFEAQQMLESSYTTRMAYADVLQNEASVNKYFELKSKPSSALSETDKTLLANLEKDTNVNELKRTIKDLIYMRPDQAQDMAEFAEKMGLKVPDSQSPRKSQDSLGPAPDKFRPEQADAPQRISQAIQLFTRFTEAGKRQMPQDQWQELAKQWEKAVNDNLSIHPGTISKYKESLDRQIQMDVATLIALQKAGKNDPSQLSDKDWTNVKEEEVRALGQAAFGEYKKARESFSSAMQSLPAEAQEKYKKLEMNYAEQLQLLQKSGLKEPDLSAKLADAEKVFMSEQAKLSPKMAEAVSASNKFSQNPLSRFVVNYNNSMNSLGLYQVGEENRIQFAQAALFQGDRERAKRLVEEALKTTRGAELLKAPELQELLKLADKKVSDAKPTQDNKPTTDSRQSTDIKPPAGDVQNRPGKAAEVKTNEITDVHLNAYKVMQEKLAQYIKESNGGKTALAKERWEAISKEWQAAIKINEALSPEAYQNYAGKMQLAAMDQIRHVMALEKTGKKSVQELNQADLQQFTDAHVQNYMKQAEAQAKTITESQKQIFSKLSKEQAEQYKAIQEKVQADVQKLMASPQAKSDQKFAATEWNKLEQARIESIKKISPELAANLESQNKLADDPKFQVMIKLEEQRALFEEFAQLSVQKLRYAQALSIQGERDRAKTILLDIQKDKTNANLVAHPIFQSLAYELKIEGAKAPQQDGSLGITEAQVKAAKEAKENFLEFARLTEDGSKTLDKSKWQELKTKWQKSIDSMPTLTNPEVLQKIVAEVKGVVGQNLHIQLALEKSGKTKANELTEDDLKKINVADLQKAYEGLVAQSNAINEQLMKAVQALPEDKKVEVVKINKEFQEKQTKTILEIRDEKQREAAIEKLEKEKSEKLAKLSPEIATKLKDQEKLLSDPKFAILLQEKKLMEQQVAPLAQKAVRQFEFARALIYQQEKDEAKKLVLGIINDKNNDALFNSQEFKIVCRTLGLTPPLSKADQEQVYKKVPELMKIDHATRTLENKSQDSVNAWKEVSGIFKEGLDGLFNSVQKAGGVEVLKDVVERTKDSIGKRIFAEVLAGKFPENIKAEDREKISQIFKVMKANLGPNKVDEIGTRVFNTIASKEQVPPELVSVKEAMNSFIKAEDKTAIEQAGLEQIKLNLLREKGFRYGIEQYNYAIKTGDMAAKNAAIDIVTRVNDNSPAMTTALNLMRAGKNFGYQDMVEMDVIRELDTGLMDAVKAYNDLIAGLKNIQDLKNKLNNSSGHIDPKELLAQTFGFSPLGMAVSVYATATQNQDLMHKSLTQVITEEIDKQGDRVKKDLNKILPAFLSIDVPSLEKQLKRIDQELASIKDKPDKAARYAILTEVKKGFEERISVGPDLLIDACRSLLSTRKEEDTKIALSLLTNKEIIAKFPNIEKRPDYKDYKEFAEEAMKSGWQKATEAAAHLGRSVIADITSGSAGAVAYFALNPRHGLLKSLAAASATGALVRPLTVAAFDSAGTKHIPAPVESLLINAMSPEGARPGLVYTDQIYATKTGVNTSDFIWGAFNPLLFVGGSHLRSVLINRAEASAPVTVGNLKHTMERLNIPSSTINSFAESSSHAQIDRASALLRELGNANTYNAASTLKMAAGKTLGESFTKLKDFTAKLSGQSPEAVEKALLARGATVNDVRLAWRDFIYKEKLSNKIETPDLYQLFKDVGITEAGQGRFLRANRSILQHDARGIMDATRKEFGSFSTSSLNGDGKALAQKLQNELKISSTSNPEHVADFAKLATLGQGPEASALAARILAREIQSLRATVAKATDGHALTGQIFSKAEAKATESGSLVARAQAQNRLNWLLKETSMGWGEATATRTHNALSTVGSLVGMGRVGNYLPFISRDSLSIGQGSQWLHNWRELGHNLAPWRLQNSEGTYLAAQNAKQFQSRLFWPEFKVDGTTAAALGLAYRGAHNFADATFGDERAGYKKPVSEAIMNTINPGLVLLDFVAGGIMLPVGKRALQNIDSPSAWGMASYVQRKIADPFLGRINMPGPTGFQNFYRNIPFGTASGLENTLALAPSLGLRLSDFSTFAAKAYQSKWEPIDNKYPLNTIKRNIGTESIAPGTTPATGPAPDRTHKRSDSGDILDHNFRTSSDVGAITSASAVAAVNSTDRVAFVTSPTDRTVTTVDSSEPAAVIRASDKSTVVDIGTMPLQYQNSMREFKSMYMKQDLTGARKAVDEAIAAASKIDPAFMQKQIQSVRAELAPVLDKLTKDQNGIAKLDANEKEALLSKKKLLEQNISDYDSFQHALGFAKLTKARLELASKNYPEAQKLIAEIKKDSPALAARKELKLDELEKQAKEPGMFAKLADTAKSTLLGLACDAIAVGAGAAAFAVTTGATLGFGAPAGFVAAGLAGSAAYSASKKFILGQELTWTDPIWGALDGMSGGAAGFMRNVGQRQVSKFFAKDGAYDAAKLAELASIRNTSGAVTKEVTVDALRSQANKEWYRIGRQAPLNPAKPGELAYGLEQMALAKAAQREMRLSGVQAMEGGARSLGVFEKFSSKIPWIGTGNQEYRIATEAQRYWRNRNIVASTWTNGLTALPVVGALRAHQSYDDYQSGKTTAVGAGLNLAFGSVFDAAKVAQLGLYGVHSGYGALSTLVLNTPDIVRKSDGLGSAAWNTVGALGKDMASALPFMVLKKWQPQITEHYAKKGFETHQMYPRDGFAFGAFPFLAGRLIAKSEDYSEAEAKRQEAYRPVTQSEAQRRLSRQDISDEYPKRK